LSKNIYNAWIDEIIILTEDCTVFPFISEKLSIRTISSRPTFDDFFETINRTTKEGDINIISNTDIYFDHSILLTKTIKVNELFLLNRWDVLSDSEIRLFPKYSTADVWIFKGKVREISASYYLGQLGCDNKLLYDLHKAGYAILNPALSILSYHLHSSNIRGEYSDPSRNNRIPAPYAYSLPTFLNAKYFFRQVFSKGPWHVIKLLIVQRSIRFQYYYDWLNGDIEHAHIVFGIKPYSKIRYWLNHDFRLKLSKYNWFRY
jgi:hypothetical protein